MSLEDRIALQLKADRAGRMKRAPEHKPPPPSAPPEERVKKPKKNASLLEHIQHLMVSHITGVDLWGGLYLPVMFGEGSYGYGMHAYAPIRGLVHGLDRWDIHIRECEVGSGGTAPPTPKPLCVEAGSTILRYALSVDLHRARWLTGRRPPGSETGSPPARGIAVRRNRVC